MALAAALLALAGFTSAQEPLKQRIIDRPPFDRLTLDKMNENKVLIIRPLALPGRRLPDKPKPTDKLRIQVLDDAQEYEVQWQNVERLELYEQMVLAEAAQLIALNKFDEAYEYFIFMFDNYPNAPGLKEAQQSYLYLSSGAAFRQQKLDEALAIVEELIAQNPAFRASPTAPTLMQVLGNIADKRIAAYVQKEDYRSARAAAVAAGAAAQSRRRAVRHQVARPAFAAGGRTARPGPGTSRCPARMSRPATPVLRWIWFGRMSQGARSWWPKSLAAIRWWRWGSSIRRWSSTLAAW